MRILPIGPNDEIAVNGSIVLLSEHDGDIVSVGPDLGTVRVTLEEVESLGTPTAPRDLGSREVDACVSLLRNRELVRFDPHDGSE